MSKTDTEQELTVDSKTTSYGSESELNEDTVAAVIAIMKTEAETELGQKTKYTWNTGGTHHFSWSSEGTEDIKEATPANNDSTPITIFLL